MARKALGAALFEGVDAEFEASETLVIDVVDLPETAGGRISWVLKGAELALDSTFVELLEGGKVLAPTVEFLTSRGIPVMAHVGLTPQAVNILGGYGVRGKSPEEAQSIVDDAIAMSDAGAFAMVIEGVLEHIAIEITQKVACPTIGIGASAQCDGQVLVAEDMLGLFDRVPKFVKNSVKWVSVSKRLCALMPQASGTAASPDPTSCISRYKAGWPIGPSRAKDGSDQF